MAFAHLHVHTEYSLLDGSNKIKEYVKRVKELGMTAAAITDHGAMYGVIDFYRAARAEGINPILGCEGYVAPNSRFDREITGGDDRYYHLVLLAENNTGYANLSKIVSRGFTEGYYYKPRVDMELLQEYHEGIIALSACLAGEVQRYIQKGLVDEAKKAALKYQDCFGKGNYFLELQDHGIPEQQTVNQVARSTGNHKSKCNSRPFPRIFIDHIPDHDADGCSSSKAEQCLLSAQKRPGHAGIFSIGNIEKVMDDLNVPAGKIGCHQVF